MREFIDVGVGRMSQKISLKGDIVSQNEKTSPKKRK
jgi:hypothetical protein